MNKDLNTLKKTARTAGLLYLILALIAPYGLIYVHGKVFVKGNAEATAQNILSNEFLFRTGIASHMISQFLFILVVWMLYKLFYPVSKHWSLIMLILAVVSVPVSFLSDALKMTGLMVLKGGILNSVDPSQVKEIARMLFLIGGYSVEMVQLYWGLWLFPFGVLVYKSGFIPRIFGILLILNGIGYVLLSMTFVLFPNAGDIVGKVTMPLLFVGELPIIFWLLIKGVRSPG